MSGPAGPLADGRLRRDAGVLRGCAEPGCGTLCAHRKLQAAEADLSRAEAALRDRLDPVGRRNLERAQQMWRLFRDRECDLETGHDADHPRSGGTIMPMLLGECAVTLTARRTRDLREQLACPGGDLSCER